MTTDNTPDELWALEVKVGDVWTIRLSNRTRQYLVDKANTLIGRTVEAGIPARLARYVLDPSHIEEFERG